MLPPRPYSQALLKALRAVKSLSSPLIIIIGFVCALLRKFGGSLPATEFAALDCGCTIALLLGALGGNKT